MVTTPEITFSTFSIFLEPSSWARVPTRSTSTVWPLGSRSYSFPWEESQRISISGLSYSLRPPFTLPFCEGLLRDPSPMSLKAFSPLSVLDALPFDLRGLAAPRSPSPVFLIPEVRLKTIFAVEALHQTSTSLPIKGFSVLNPSSADNLPPNTPPPPPLSSLRAALPFELCRCDFIFFLFVQGLFRQKTPRPLPPFCPFSLIVCMTNPGRCVPHSPHFPPVQEAFDGKFFGLALAFLHFSSFPVPGGAPFLLVSGPPSSPRGLWSSSEIPLPCLILI